MDNIVFISKIREHSSSTVLDYYIKRVFDSICFLKKDYPEFKKWYDEKVVPGIKSGKREIVIKEINGEIAAVSILKNDVEKKICTFLVLPKYQEQGIGKEMLQISLDILNTDKPMITVSSNSINSFIRLLNNFNFEKQEELDGYYKKGSKEYVFNGSLTNNKNFKIA